MGHTAVQLEGLPHVFGVFGQEPWVYGPTTANKKKVTTVDST